MKKINVYYKEIKLGELRKIGTNFVYTANFQNIELAHQKGYVTFLYRCDESFLSQELPYSLESLVPSPENFEANLFANIIPTDSMFERLYKMAQLKDVIKPDFHVSIS